MKNYRAVTFGKTIENSLFEKLSRSLIIEKLNPPIYFSFDFKNYRELFSIDFLFLFKNYRKLNSIDLSMYLKNYRIS